MAKNLGVARILKVIVALKKGPVSLGTFEIVFCLKVCNKRDRSCTLVRLPFLAVIGLLVCDVRFAKIGATSSGVFSLASSDHIIRIFQVTRKLD